MKIARFTDHTQVLGHGIVQGDCILRIERAPEGGLENWLALGAAALAEIGYWIERIGVIENRFVADQPQLLIE